MWSRRLSFGALFVALTSMAACASAGKSELSGRPDGGLHPTGDAGGSDVDAALGHDAAGPPVDASQGPGPHTLTAATSPTDDGSAIACSAADALGVTLYTDQNSYYRVFPLADYSIGNAFHVTNVDFTIEDVEAGPVALTVKVGTYAGTPGATLTKSNIQMTGTASHSAATGDTTASVPVTADVAAGGVVVVEIDAPSGQTGSKFFYMGSSSGGESEPSYISSTATDCGATTPTNVTTAAGAPTDWLISVTGNAD